MPSIASSTLYYAQQIPPMLRGFRELPTVFRLLLRHLLRHHHAGRATTVTLRRSGLQFRVRNFIELWCLRETFIERAYERYGFALEPGWNVVDVGAAMGDFTLFASIERGAGLTLAVEPSPATYALLQDAIATNGASNVTTLQAAVSDKEGVLYLDAHGIPTSMGSSAVATPGSVPVAAIPLMRALERGHMDRCDLLKLDCEGAEFDILRALSPDDFRRIDRVVLEYHEQPGNDRRELRDILKNAGYEVRITPSPVHAGLGYLAAVRNDALTG